MLNIVKALMVAGLFFVGNAQAEDMSSDSNNCSDASFSMCEYMSSESECVDSGCMWNPGSQTCGQGFQVMHGHGHGCHWLGRHECFRSRHCFWEHGSCHRNRW